MVSPGHFGDVQLVNHHQYPYNNSIWGNHHKMLIDPLRRLCLYLSMYSAHVVEGQCAHAYEPQVTLWPENFKMQGVRHADLPKLTQARDSTVRYHDRMHEFGKACAIPFSDSQAKDFDRNVTVITA